MQCHQIFMLIAHSSACTWIADNPLSAHKSHQHLPEEIHMQDFFETLRIQRWDDHRYYHHSRINQSLHLISAISFLVSYVYLFIDPVMAGLIAWLVSMTTRQIGHFFLNPKGLMKLTKLRMSTKKKSKWATTYNAKLSCSRCVA